VVGKQAGIRISVQRVLDSTTGERRLYRNHSTTRHSEDRGIAKRFRTRLEGERQYLAVFTGALVQVPRQGPRPHLYRAQHSLHLRDLAEIKVGD